MKTKYLSCRSTIHRSNAGFGFVEVMVSLVFIFIIVGLTANFTAALESDDERKLRQAREGIMLLKSGLETFAFDEGERLPPTLEEGGLNVLVSYGYMDQLAKDPWGNDYQYIIPGVHSGRPYDLFSMGPDGKTSDDDITDWELFSKVMRDEGRPSRKAKRLMLKELKSQGSEPVSTQ